MTTVAEREEILAAPGFGRYFTDHMVVATWTSDAGWTEPAVRPYEPFTLDPASAVLHYGQEIFEGLKAYRHQNGSIHLFRPDANAERMRRSAARLALPAVPAETFRAALDLLVRADADWVPDSGPDDPDGPASLYLRPFAFGSEAFLGVRPANHVTFCVIASPARSYFSAAARPIALWLSRAYARASAGGTGAAKCGGNYAASLLPQREAVEHGCEQVVFTDGAGRVDEAGSSNIFFVYDDATLVTPETSGTILEGITRDSILKLASDLGLSPVERPVTVEEWREGVTSGRITEVFASGTAAVLTPVGRLRWSDGEVGWGGETAGPVTARLRRELLDVQFGRAEDRFGWLHEVVPASTSTSN